MTPSEQRGYDDQMAGRIDADLFCADGPDAICYRNGARAARRELAMNADEKGFQRADYVMETTTQVKQSGTPSEFTPVIIGNPVPNIVTIRTMETPQRMTQLSAPEASPSPAFVNFIKRQIETITGAPAPADLSVTIRSKLDIGLEAARKHDTTPNAFADPQPGKRRRKPAPPKADVADSEQLGLL